MSDLTPEPMLLSDTDLFAALTQLKSFSPMLAQAVANHIAARAIERGTLERKNMEQAEIAIERESLFDAIRKESTERREKIEALEEHIRRKSLEPLRSLVNDLLKLVERLSLDTRGGPFEDGENSIIDRARSLALCPHGMPLAENVCGICSEGRPNALPESLRDPMKVLERGQQIERAGGLAFCPPIHLVKEGSYTVVKVEIRGKWIEVIREASGPFSHIWEGRNLYELIERQSTKTKETQT